MTAFRSRMNGHRHVSFGQWLGCVAIASVVPSIVGLALMLAAHLMGGFSAAEDSFGAVLGVVGTVMAFGIVYAWIAILVAATLALAFLRFGWGGWAVPTLVGGLLTGAFGVLVLEQPLGAGFAIMGATYGICLWAGLAWLAPNALNDSPETAA